VRKSFENHRFYPKFTIFQIVFLFLATVPAKSIQRYFAENSEPTRGAGVQMGLNVVLSVQLP
jgi:hypothetical protein